MTRTVFLLLAVLAAPAAAQSPVERAAARLQAGDVAGARAALAAAWSDGAPPAAIAPRAYLMRARLTPDVEAALDDYLTVALGHPTSREAPVALVRLGQAVLELGQPGRAAGYLERVISDYPASGARGIALLWLARAELAQDRVDAACRALTAARLATGGDAELSALVRDDLEAHCQERAAATPGMAPNAAPQSPATPAVGD